MKTNKRLDNLINNIISSYERGPMRDWLTAEAYAMREFGLTYKRIEAAIQDKYDMGFSAIPSRYLDALQRDNRARAQRGQLIGE